MGLITHTHTHHTINQIGVSHGVLVETLYQQNAIWFIDRCLLIITMTGVQHLKKIYFMHFGHVPNWMGCGMLQNGISGLRYISKTSRSCWNRFFIMASELKLFQWQHGVSGRCETRCEINSPTIPLISCLGLLQNGLLNSLLASQPHLYGLHNPVA